MQKANSNKFVNVSKSLKFCAGPVTTEGPNWNNLLKRNLLLAYMNKLGRRLD